MGSNGQHEGLSVLNAFPRRIPGPNLLHLLVQGTGCGDNLAIEYLSETGSRTGSSYPELHASSNALAAKILEQLNLMPRRKPEDQIIIPVMIPQSPDLYISLLAILKAGCAFCPVNLDAPQERVRFIIGDTNASLLLTVSSLSAKFPASNDELKFIFVDDPVVMGEALLLPQARIPDEDGLAYVMYTSGSTGTPKGVGISHLAATQSLLAHQRHVPEFSRFLQFAAPTFDVSVFEIFFPLFRGATLVSCHRGELLTDLPGVIQRMQVDACELTPSVAGSLLKRRDNAPSLGLLLTIGEMLTEPVVNEFGGESELKSMLWGMYGPTEAAIHCTLQPAFRKHETSHCVGFPLDTVSAFVIAISDDGHAAEPFKILPTGEVGELVVGGFQLAKGYINRPDQTAKAFINSSFGRVYKTGDKARMREDGIIECLGRVAEGQVKLHGQRMELGEIEHAILKTAGCHSAFVAVLSGMLIAFAAVDDEEGMQDRIIGSCKAWLPAFMVPTEVILKCAFPRLPSGKIDRMRLKQDYLESKFNTIDEPIHFKDDLERLLCETVGKVLHSKVSPSTRLASVGLDSLTAIELTTVLRGKGVLATTIDVLDAATVSGLHHALRVREAEARPVQMHPNGHLAPRTEQMWELLRKNPATANQIEGIESVTTCTALQASMLIETFKDPRIYINSVQISFPSGSTASSIESWFSKVADQNEILRSGFIQLSGALAQITWKKLSDDQVTIVEHIGPTAPFEKFLQRPFQVQILGPTLSEAPEARVTVHHAIYDGWTIDLLLNDLSLIAKGDELPSRPQFRAISDYYDGPERYTEHNLAKEFWTEHLSGMTGSSLPNFRTTAVPKSEITTASWVMDVGPQKVRQLSIHREFSPQAFFQACLAWLWAAVTGNDDIVLGAVFSGRTIPVPEIEQIMGPCIQTLPVRVRLGEVRTKAELVQSLHALSRQMLRVAFLPLPEVKRAAGIPPGGRLFEVLFVYQESFASRKLDNSLVRETWHKDALETKLLVEIEPRNDRYVCQWTWHSDVFSEPQVETLNKHLCHVATSFINDIDQALDGVIQSFPQLSLSLYPSALESVATTSSLAALVEKSVVRWPDHDAIHFAESIDDSSVRSKVLSYDELNRSANQIARHLIASGCKPNGLVAIIMEKSPLFYCCVLGILKTGCGYLPLLPSTPEKRVRSILEQATPQQCLVVGAAQWNSLKSSSYKFIEVCDAELAEYDDSNLEIPQEPSQPAYVIYTSGTTGIPKGVTVTNGNILSNLEVLSNIYPHCTRSRMLQICSQAFDVSVFEIFFTWANGMCLCAGTNDTLFQDLEESIRRLCVTHLSMTVTVASLVDPKNLPNVEFLVAAGEPLTDEVLERWAGILYQGYGPSEMTNICTVRKVSHGDCSQYLGWPLKTTSSFVFRPGTAEPVPIGCVGELVFGGGQVAAGYLNMPELTDEKFFDHAQYGRLYRSGDLGRMLPDGSLIILGRLDTQIKLRGQRIELEEIHSLALDSGLARACATTLFDRRGTKSQHLVLFYVPTDEDSHSFMLLPLTSRRQLKKNALTQTLQGALPIYMVPSFLVPISSLPLTASGKTDNKCLRKVIETLAEDELSQYSLVMNTETVMAEWSQAEKQIVDALSETLRLDRTVIGPWTSFAALGLDSVSAMPLARRLQSRFNKRVPLTQILRNPNVSRLAQSITTTEISPTARANIETILSVHITEDIRRRFAQRDLSVETVLPCTPLQEAMLAASASDGIKASYSNQMLFELGSAPEEMMMFWNEMCRRHGILRTCFITSEHTDNPFYQVILKRSPISWTRFSGSDVDQCATEHMYDLPTPIDSFKPPISLAIISTSNGKNYLSFTCHHALYDGVAISVLLSEVEAMALGQQISAPPSFALFLQEALTLPSDATTFWSSHLETYRPLHLPRADKLDEIYNAGVPSTEVLGCSNLPFRSIESRLRVIGVSLLSLCQAAWAVTLSSVISRSDVCFGNVVSGRSAPIDNIDRLVAPCFNTIPMRIKLSDLGSNRELMKKCQSLNAETLQYQFTPLRKIQSFLHLGNVHLFDTLLLLQPPSRPLKECVWSLRWDHGSMDMPIVCEVLPSVESDILNVIMHRDPDLHSKAMAQLLLDLFVDTLNACLQYPASVAKIRPELSDHMQATLHDLASAQPAPPNQTEGVSSPRDERWDKEELAIRDIVARLSRTPKSRIRKDTSIHRLGLDSIGAVQLAYLLRQNGLRVSAVDVLQHPTCAGIASLARELEQITVQQIPTYDLDAFHAQVHDQIADTGLSRGPKLVLPCTPLQQGMISQFILSEGKSYFNFVSWTLAASLDVPRLLDAWASMSRRHEILRAGFIPVSHPDTRFAMVVYDHQDAAVPIKLLGDEHPEFDAEQWRLDCSRQALNRLERPSWGVAIVDQAGSKSMHLAMHHALYDAFSLRQLLHQLALAVEGLSLGPPVSIRPSVASLLGRAAQGSSEAEVFWQAKVSEFTVNLFPVMTPLRVSKRRIMRATHTCGLPRQRLREYASQASVTIQAALQSAWARVLSSYLGEACVTFGVVFSGRESEDINEALFPHITTLPVIAQTSNSNHALLQSMMDYNASIRRYEQTPVSQIQRWVGHPDATLFDTVLVYQTFADENEISQPWQTSLEAAVVDYPISIEFEEVSHGTCHFNVVFYDDVLPREQADLLLIQFERIFLHLLESPHGYADDLVTLSPEIYSVLPAESPVLPSEVTLLHQFVEQGATKHPDTTALEFVDSLGAPSRKWTYRQLNETGNRVANLFIANGIQGGGIVALLFDKCPEAYFTILGVLKAGCAFVALDPGAPASRQEFILRDSEAVALIVKRGKKQCLEFISPAPVLEIHSDSLEASSATSPELRTNITPEDTCYCLYTSGTTGTPKGCLISHDNCVQAMLAFQRLFAGHWDFSSRWLQFASLHFDVSVLEQYWSWSVGITLVSAPRDLILSDLVSIISKLRITHIDLTPSLARLLHPDEVPSLCEGVFITGGEQLRQDILDVWGSKGVIYNAYGPTEATIGVTMYQRVPQNGRSSNVGRQFPNVGAYVLQPDSDIPVLKGGVGELCVSGRLVGKGYLNRTDLTQERFPTLGRYHERVYRTGDLVRVLDDGCFDFLGRADDQVKLRGQRLEIGEINHAIRSGVAAIYDVATLVAKRGKERDVLISFIVTNTSRDHGGDLDVVSDGQSLKLCNEAQDACRAKLPGYMVPTYVFAIPFIPLSANNKAQTSVLKQLFNDLTHEQLRQLTSRVAQDSAQLSMREPQLALILAEVTNVAAKDIWTSSTIFQLSIDSISVIELARQLRAAGFPGASPSVILKHPHLGTLAKVLREVPKDQETSRVLRAKQSILACYHRHLGAACRTYGISPSDIEYIAPCTPLQEGMLSRSAIADGSGTYFNTFRLDLLPDTSIARLRQAWGKVLDLNAVLRTRFLQTSEGYIQVALRSQNIPWFDCNTGNESTNDLLKQRYEAWVKANGTSFAKPFEIDCVEHDGQRTLVIHIFHGIYDARSFDLMLRIVGAAYKGQGPPTGPTFLDVLPHGPLCDYSTSRQFWQDLFRDFTFKPMPAIAIFKNDQRTTVLSRTCELQSVERRRIALGVTQQTIVQTAWLYALKQLFPAWPTLGIIFSGRSLLLHGIENTIGPLFNTLPFRVKGIAVSSWSELIQETHQFNSTVLSFAHVPLHQIQKWCNRGQPMFDTLFAFDREDPASTNACEGIWTEVSTSSIADYPLAFEGIVTKENELRVTIVAQSHIADEAALDALLENFERVLSAIAQDQDITQTGNLEHEVQADPRPFADNKQIWTDISDLPADLFTWTDQARGLRDEIAAVAGVPTSEVREDTTLFELGLDSIDVVKLVARFRRIGVNLTTSQLMKRPTVQSILASGIVKKPSIERNLSPLNQLESEIAKLRGFLTQTDHDLASIEEVLPPTPLQESMAAEMIGSSFRRYFNHDVLRILPGVSIEKLKEAIEEVVANSPVLRTRFIEVDDPRLNMAYCQVIANRTHWLREDITAKSLDDLDDVFEESRRIAMSEQGELFQLRFASVMQTHYMILSISHALYDGMALDLFHQDVQAAYEGHFQPRASYKPTLACILATPSDQAEAFWSNFLLRGNATFLPKLHDNHDVQEYTVHRVEAVSLVQVSSIHAFCKHRRITPQVLGQACWAAVLASLTRSLDITFGMVLSGRDTEEAQRILLPTFNTVPVRVIIHGSTVEYLQYIWENLSSIREFQHFPLRKAQKLAGKGPLFNTLFIMQSRLREPEERRTTLWKSVRSASEVEYPVCVEMEMVGASLVWRLACDDQYVNEKQTTRLMGQLDQVLRALVEGDVKEVLDFGAGDDQVSICGLPPFTLPNTINSDKTISETHGSNTIDRSSISMDDECASTILDVLADIAGVARPCISLAQSIYHLGLDSISAIKASSMLSKLGFFVSVREMVKAASIEEIISCAQKSDASAQYRQTPTTSAIDEQVKVQLNQYICTSGVEARTVERALPALPMQVHMLSVWQNTSGQLFFYEFTYLLSGTITRSKVERAWRDLVSETPILRTTFAATGREDLPFIQVVQQPQRATEVAANNESDASSWQLRLSNSPFACIHILQDGTSSTRMKLKIHHALYDGISLPTIMKRFEQLCNTDRASRINEGDIWASFVRHHYSSRVRSDRKQFWTTYLGDILPASSKLYQISSTTQESSRTTVFRPEALKDTERLRATASTHGISIQALFFAAYAKIIARARPMDVVFGIYLANRTAFDERLQKARFPTLSITPLRVRINNEDESLLSIAARTQQDLGEISSFENASIGLWEIEKWTGVKIDSFINFLSLPDSHPAPEAANGEEVQVRKDISRYSPTRSLDSLDYDGLADPSDSRLRENTVRSVYTDALDVEVAMRGHGLDIGVFCSGQIMSQAGATEFVDRIVKVLQDVV